MYGDTATLECFVTGASLNTTTPFVQLFGPEEVALVNSTNFNLTHTLDPVLVRDAGPYFCKAILEVEGLDVPLNKSSIHGLFVQGNTSTIIFVSHSKIMYLFHHQFPIQQ